MHEPEIPVHHFKSAAPYRYRYDIFRTELFFTAKIFLKRFFSGDMMNSFKNNTECNFAVTGVYWWISSVLFSFTFVLCIVFCIVFCALYCIFYLIYSVAQWNAWRTDYSQISKAGYFTPCHHALCCLLFYVLMFLFPPPSSPPWPSAPPPPPPPPHVSTNLPQDLHPLPFTFA